MSSLRARLGFYWHFLFISLHMHKRESFCKICGSEIVLHSLLFPRNIVFFKLPLSDPFPFRMQPMVARYSQPWANNDLPIRMTILRYHIGLLLDKRWATTVCQQRQQHLKWLCKPWIFIVSKFNCNFFSERGNFLLCLVCLVCVMSKR